MIGWKYYNNALIPTCFPHEIPNLAPIEDKSILKNSGRKVFFVRWTSDFDCGYQTNWWYCIKDTPFDKMGISSKKKYEINKSIRNFECLIIDPMAYIQEIYRIQQESFATYPKKYRPKVEYDSVVFQLKEWTTCTVIGAFSRDNHTLVGYSMLKKTDKFIAFCVQKVIPNYEKMGVNAALIYEIFTYFNEDIKKGAYICDGERNVIHETKFQEYLEKYFGFRKAYCKLNVKYRNSIKLFVKVLYCVRPLLKKLDGIRIVHKINAVLLMEEIIRAQNTKQKD